VLLEQRDEIPPEARSIPRWARLYWQAFGDLIDEREYLQETQLLPSAPGAPPVMIIANKPRRIAWRTLDAYAERGGFCGEERVLFLRLMRAMDDELLKVKAEQGPGQTEPSEDEHG